MPPFRTNLLRIKTLLEETVKKLDGVLKQEEIERWIQQFDDDEEQILCLKLLQNLRFYDYVEIQQLCGICHNRLLMDLNRDNMDKIFFVPVKGEGKSGSFLMYLYRMENDVDEKKVTSYEKIAQSKDYDTIVFIDDLIGTGNQFINFIRENSLRKYFTNGINVYYLALVGFEGGIKKIEDEIGIKVKVGQKLLEQDLPLSPKSPIFNDEEKKKMKSILEKYGNKLWKDNALGYNNFGALLSFEYRSPNITYTVMWGKKKNWFPVLKRYSKEN